ncbi:protein kinase domain-containing protein [Streptomyces turgidiscabies]|uniref:non-specific serine/threonine protein kinase n=3 Tax=Streptomyces TaxID=1883 RepID=L7EUV5_STRT8|nr:Stk1 family PASTA domain-containing Ser/Thr kinase [Streptomyces turgidiscabies]ELP62837.1 kinase domain protein [Streptomyces turgidiscabies Car8]MDX3492204.1 protein kinase [Streptomyces turgidiscabies]GAQ69505.1 serine/threonine-protein kinase PknB [Streptomyces turgidiscabies]
MSQDGAHGRYAGHALAGGRYQLRDLLGEGGMASVHLAYDSVLDRQVAVKTLHTELGREQAFRERFRREAQAVAKLTHTNIVSVFDTGEDDVAGTMTPYIVMEYVEGEPLGSVLDADLRQFGAMPADKALKVTADVLAALEISHEMGLVHRDIKPGNVMVTRRGVVKVMDFGIARAMQSGVTSMTQTGMVVGTPQYLSPEQALGRAVDARSDLYSVGIMLFQLVTGRLPFNADSPLAIAYAHVQEQPVAPSSVNRALPPAVDALVNRALKKNPNERFPSAVAMRDECLRVAASLQPAAPNIVPGTPAQSGAGVASAVFPPVDQSTPAPPNPVQTPYQPTPYPQHANPQHPNPYGTTPPPAYTPAPTPPQTPAPAYGYPQQAAYQAPGAYASQHTPPVAYSPAPASPSSSGGGRKSNTPVIVGSIVVALVAVGGLLLALKLGGDTTDNGGGTGSDSSASASASQTAETGTDPGADSGGDYKGPDLSKTIEEDKCAEAQESYTDPDKVQLPDFRYKNLTSVKACFQAAGWRMKVTRVDENTFGKDTVTDQFPSAGTDVDPEDMPVIELSVSSGNPS